MAVAKKGFEFFFNRLLKGFRSVEKREPNNLEMILIKQEARNKAVDANKVIEVNFDPQNRWKDKKGITSLLESGDVKVGKAPKTPPYEKSQADIEFEIMEKIKSDNEKAIRAFESRNPNKKPKDEDPGFYTGGMVDVEPSLSDIGHGSDSLMARTRLISPGAQGTTSTGLNYLLAEDNDNIRVPFAGGYNVPSHKDYLKQMETDLHKHFKRYKKIYGGKMKFNQFRPKFIKEYAEGGRIGFQGGGMGRRAFLKLLAALSGGIAGIKSGILGLSEGAGKKAVTETIKKAGAANEVPPYFFKLVDKIKTLGDETLASQDKAIAKKYKDYVMEEDFAGNITIIKKESLTDNPYPKDVYMSYKVDEVPVKGKTGSTKVEEYEEFTARPDGDGKMKDVDDGVPDEVIMEVEAGSGNVPESFYTGPNKIKKASGGIAQMIGE